MHGVEGEERVAGEESEQKWSWNQKAGALDATLRTLLISPFSVD